MSASEVILGYNGFTLLKQRREWTKENGYTITQTWQGPQALVKQFEAYLAFQGASRINSETGVPGTIDATFTGSIGGAPIDGVTNADADSENNAIWELIGETVEKRLETHGKFIADATSVNIPILEEIEKAIRDGTAADTDWEAVHPCAARYNAYRDLRISGVDSYQSYTFRLRRTVTASLDTILKPSFNNVGKVVSWATATAKMFGAKFSQPTIHMVVPYSGGGAFSDEAVNEWLTQPPSVTFDRRARKWMFVEEWIGAVKISGTLYDGGGANP